jgi:DNA-binding transcriptional ArsR family regulator
MAAAPPPYDVFRALADPTRCAIVELLRGSELPVGDIASRFRVSRPAISRHLRVLRRARLVRERRQGRLRLCALDPVSLSRVDAWLAAYRSEWQGRLARLKRHLENPRVPETA